MAIRRWNIIGTVRRSLRETQNPTCVGSLRLSQAPSQQALRRDTKGIILGQSSGCYCHRRRRTGRVILLFNHLCRVLPLSSFWLLYSDWPVVSHHLLTRSWSVHTMVRNRNLWFFSLICEFFT